MGLKRYLLWNDAIYGYSSNSLILIIVFPQIALWLPAYLYGQ